MTGTRHLLVVASQCTAMGPPLPNLAAVAGDLHDAFRDVALGGCHPGLPDGRALILLDDPEQTNADVYATVRTAIGHAAAHQATLVLALIGHGFVAGRDPTLYFMAPSSEEEVRDKAVNVNELLVEAADRHGVAGVIGIIDTCNAAAAAVDPAKLTAGIQAGDTALSIVMASAFGQPARDLNLSRELTALVRTGSDTAGAAVFAEDLDAPLRSRIGGQTLAVNSYNGKNGGRDALWLAANPRYTVDHGWDSVTAHSAARLAALIRAVDETEQIPERWDETALRRLKAKLAERAATPPAEWDLIAEAARIKLTRLADALVVAVRTAAFLRSWLSASLTTARLRTAVARLRPGPGGSLIGIPGSAFARAEHVVEHVALNHPNAQDDCRKWICRFVVALAQDAGRPLTAPELLTWARDIDAVVPFNNAVETAKTEVDDRRLRLIVSLHASPAGDWPPTLDAWLLDGTELIDHGVIRNRAVPDRAGTDEALAKAVDWAEEVAARNARGAQLQRLEIAVPSSLMLEWRPEEGANDRRLGIDYDVVLRWSQRLNPPAGRTWIDRRARTRWKRISSPDTAAPVDWLSRHHILDPKKLHELLRNDHFAQAVGLDHLPGTVPMPGSELLDLLLTFSPVVLWPSVQEGFPSHCQDAFNDYWHTLPTGFTDAYREQWREDRHADPADVVARLRAVWDDLEWLDFCATNRRMASTRQRGTL
jgi:hypothetical protein